MKSKQQKNQVEKQLTTVVNNFYNDASIGIKKIEEARIKDSRKNAPWFNAFDFWQLYESKIVEILAFFLNPNASHEQGDRYLKHFIEKFGIDSFSYNKQDKIVVKHNVPTDGGTHIDIVIYKNSFEEAIAIISKKELSSSAFKKELEDYNNYLWNRTGDDFCLIYIGSNEASISTKSLSKEERRELERSKKFKYLRYDKDLIGCIEEFSNITESKRVKTFLKDFEKAMRKKYLNEKDYEIKKSMIELINKNQKNLEISFMIANSLPEVKQKLKERFNSQIKSLKKELNLDVKQENGRVWLKPKNWQYHYFSYACENGHLIYGMTQDKRENNKNKFKGLLNYLNEKGDGPFYSNEWWPAYKYQYKDIDSNPDFWKAIKNGKAKSEMKKFILLMLSKYEKDLFYE